MTDSLVRRRRRIELGGVVRSSATMPMRPATQTPVSVGTEGRSLRRAQISVVCAANVTKTAAIQISRRMRGGMVLCKVLRFRTF